MSRHDIGEKEGHDIDSDDGILVKQIQEDKDYFS